MNGEISTTETTHQMLRDFVENVQNCRDFVENVQ